MTAWLEIAHKPVLLSFKSLARFFPVDLDFGEESEEVKKLSVDAGKYSRFIYRFPWCDQSNLWRLRFKTSSSSSPQEKPQSWRLKFKSWSASSLTWREWSRTWLSSKSTWRRCLWGSSQNPRFKPDIRSSMRPWLALHYVICHIVLWLGLFEAFSNVHFLF